MRRANSDLLSIAPLTMLFLAINIVLYIYCAIQSGDFSDIHSNILISMGGSLREFFWEGDWTRIIMPNFLHGGLLHILFNSMSLWQVGPGAEMYFGSANFGTIYILSGVSGFCFSQIFGGNLSIGASCSLFGILGAILAIKVLAAPILKNAWKNSDVRQQVYFLLAYLLIGFSGMLGNVDNWGHLGGLIVGILVGLMFELWRKNHPHRFLCISAVLLVVTGIVCAARWSIFNPTYHVYMAVVAKEEGRDAESQKEFEKAIEWSKFWNKDDR